MRKRITLLLAALMMALTMSFSGVAFGAITKEKPGQGNPATNPSGKCPGGHNKNEPGNAFSSKCD